MEKDNLKCPLSNTTKTIIKWSAVTFGYFVLGLFLYVKITEGNIQQLKAIDKTQDRIESIYVSQEQSQNEIIDSIVSLRTTGSKQIQKDIKDLRAFVEKSNKETQKLVTIHNKKYEEELSHVVGAAPDSTLDIFGRNFPPR